MKRGGHVGKHRSKPKIKVMVAPEVAASPPSPDPSMAAAGVGSSPAPAPMPPPGQPPMKRGGRAEGGEVSAGQEMARRLGSREAKAVVDKSKEAFARGGRAYPKHGGAATGDGRLDLAKLQKGKK